MPQIYNPLFNKHSTFITHLADDPLCIIMLSHFAIPLLLAQFIFSIS